MKTLIMSAIMLLLCSCSIPEMSHGMPNRCKTEKTPFVIPKETMRVTLSDDQNGLLVYMNGVYVGMTPLDTLVPSSFSGQNVMFMLTTQDRQIVDSWSTVLEGPWAKGDEETPINGGHHAFEKNPDKIFGSCSPYLLKTGKTLLTIGSNPPGADVNINGFVVGQTPLLRYVNSSNGDRVSMTVVKNGFQFWAGQVILVGGGQLRLYVRSGE
jgi:hypothetical protein